MAQIPRLYGVNAYYLLVESYRKVQQQPGRVIKDVVMDYLIQDLRLPELRRRSRINAIRFWAFNDYPVSAVGVPDGSFDAALWLEPNRVVQPVLSLLNILVEGLSALDFYLFPVLGNYWLSYGGILRYLEWVGAIPKGTWLNAFTTLQDQDKYLKYGADFYLNPRVEQLFQNHTGQVLSILSKYPKVIGIDILNEPRGKGFYAQQNRPVKPQVYMQVVVADWLQRQAVFIQKNMSSSVYITSGEEGWFAQSPRLPLNYLKSDPQTQEGVDLSTNMTRPNLTMGTIHMYTHPAAELQKTSLAGLPFTDRRGWDFLLRTDRPGSWENYKNLGDEWLRSRSLAMDKKPWYLGELGWCRPRSDADKRPLSNRELQDDRITLYRHWTELAFSLKAQGVFLWLLDGLQHQDEFYGMTQAQIQAIFPA
ncbi:hypothetical protein [Gloeomargarita lithophora]|nr:hypothetical protein [Gloeomargarita lithophora]